MEDGGGAVLALEDCGGVTALGGDIGRWFKIAAVAWGSGGGRQTWDDGIGISVVEAEGLYYGVGSSISKDGERGPF